MYSTSGSGTAATKNRWLLPVGLLVVLAIGFWVRFDSLSVWLAEKDRYFLADEQTPLMLNVDGYYYLDIAKQVQTGQYKAFDPRRHVPSGFDRSTFPPLLSVITAGLSSLFTSSLELVAILLPPVLGSLLVIPVFLLARAMGRHANLAWIDPDEREVAAIVMGLTAAVLSALSPFLVARSSIGFFDTDALNVTFAVLAAYFAMRYGDEQTSRRRHYWFAAWSATLLIYLWWWEQSVIPVLALAGLPMLIAVIHVGRRSWHDILPLAIAGAVLLLLLGAWKGFAILNPILYWERLGEMFAYITSDRGDSVFAASGQYVSEQTAVSLQRLAVDGAGGWLGFAAACIGLLGLIFAVRWRALYLMALMIVAALSLTGSRFLIFTAPLFGLGVGFIAFLLWDRAGQPVLRTLMFAVLLVGVAWGAVAKTQKYDDLVPKRLPILLDAMQAIGSRTAANSVVWAHWSHGHPMVFYTDRGTMADGIWHPSEIGYMTAAPQATDDPRLAANWISFSVAHGIAGLEQANTLFGKGPEDWAHGMPRLQQLLAAGPQAAREILRKDGADIDSALMDRHLRFLFPGTPRPVYMFLDSLSLTYGWYKQGGWDFANARPLERGPYILLKQLQPASRNVLFGHSSKGNVLLDLGKGLIRIGDKTVNLKRVRLLAGTKMKQADYHASSRYVVNVIKKAGFGVLTNIELADSVLHKLYFEVAFDKRYFAPFSIKLPYLSIWQVEGEKYEPTNVKTPIAQISTESAASN
jgi:MFS family permease